MKRSISDRPVLNTVPALSWKNSCSCEESSAWRLPQRASSWGYPAGLGCQGSAVSKRFGPSCRLGDPVREGPSGGWIFSSTGAHDPCAFPHAFRMLDPDLERLKGAISTSSIPMAGDPFALTTDRRQDMRSIATASYLAVLFRQPGPPHDHGAGFRRDGRAAGRCEPPDRSCRCRQPVRPAWQPRTISAPGERISARYTVLEREQRCFYCGEAFSSNSACERGHYVCDRCHMEDGIGVIRHICRHSGEADLIRLFARIRQHPAIPVHGPEHHPMVAGIILAGYRNVGGKVPADILQTAISRGCAIAGGACAFRGGVWRCRGGWHCPSLLLSQSPDRQGASTCAAGKPRGDSGGLRSGRRPAVVSGRAGSPFPHLLSCPGEVLPIRLEADTDWSGSQRQLNRECLGQACPLFPGYRVRAAVGRCEGMVCF